MVALLIEKGNTAGAHFMPDGLNFLSNVEERECAVYDPSVFPVPCVIGPPGVRMRWGTQQERTVPGQGRGLLFLSLTL